jgi:ATP-dependent DNA helicase RecG
MPKNDLSDIDITSIKGIGAHMTKMLLKLGIKSVIDAVYYLPYRYEDRSNLKKIEGLICGETETVCGTIISAETTQTHRFKIFVLTLRDDTGMFQAKWFNQAYLSKTFHKGQSVIFNGLIKHGVNANCFEMQNPEYEIITDDLEDNVHTNRIVPVYKTTAGLTVKTLRKTMFNIINTALPFLEEQIPPQIIKKYGLIGIHDCIKTLHFPDTDVDIESLIRGESPAHIRLAFNELFFLELGLVTLRRDKERDIGIAFNIDQGLKTTLIKNLPFKLTFAQSRVLKDISNDMKKPTPMNRLIQGDVGSGKTIVALLAMLDAIDSGYQAVVMAPTEILAIQHYINISKLLKDFDKIGVCLLTGKKAISCRTLTESDSCDDVRKEIKNGLVSIIIGTHSLIQESVGFDRLGLIVIDEQHRFGVMQRAKLQKKGIKGVFPDILIMTATPIPRTLALTLYGDMNYSVIDELPPGRKPVRTLLYYESHKQGVYDQISRELNSGGRIYVVYPLVEDSETMDLHSAIKGKEAFILKFKEARVGLIHGRMKVSEKQAVMNEFKDGLIDILVCTTVIEVGIDVPEATLMLIIHAERFGLSQLHQLRGRVGRGKRESLCILLAYYPMSEEAKQRMAVMVKTSNGFEIAEEDLKIRGPGEFLGTKQSGLPDLKVTDINKHASLLQAAKDEAEQLLCEDPQLTKYPLLKKGLNDFWHGKIEIVKTL